MGIKELAHCIPLISKGRIHYIDRGSLSSGLDEEHAKRFGTRVEGGDKTIM